MIDAVMCVLVIVMTVVGANFFTRKLPAVVVPLMWLAIVEVFVFTIFQEIYCRINGGDTVWYRDSGLALSKYVDQNFTFMFPEVVKLLFQTPSRIDRFPEVNGPGTNTGSMFAMSTLIIYFIGSDYAAAFVVAGLAFFGNLLIFRALHDADPDLPPRQMFVATVLFPSIAFWTATFNKESFCMMGIGLALTAWRAFYRRRWLLALVTGPLGVLVLGLYRAPTLLPLCLGIAIYLVWQRLKQSRGGDAIILGPIYLALGFVVVAVGMMLVGRLDANFGIDQVGETMGRKQAMWSRAHGGSDMDVDEEDIAPSTLGEQLANAPLALTNALFRPQFFDVHNFGTAISAVEMTILSFLLARAIFRRGLRGIMTDIERSPLMLMCAVITFVGCAFVGLVTYNLGSLARYRVPFLPFYGTVIVFLSQGTKVVASVTTKVKSIGTLGPRARENASTKA